MFSESGYQLSSDITLEYAGPEKYDNKGYLNIMEVDDKLMNAHLKK